MRIVQYVIVAAWGFAWRAGVLVIATAWIVAMCSRGWNPSSDAVDEAPSSPASSLVSDPTELRMRVAAGRPYSFYSLKDEEGNELARVTYARSSIVVTMGGTLPIHPGLSVGMNGSCDFGVSQGSVHYRFKLRPGGTSGFSVIGGARGVKDGLGVNEEGELVHDPTVFERP
jgi:hypothetical protein